MKKFTIAIGNELSEFYEDIAKVCNKTTEEILQDTLYKVVDIMAKAATREE